MRNALVAGTALLAFAWASPQTDRGGPRLLQVASSADGTEQEYAIYVPHSYDAARKYPLILALHEEDSNHIAQLKHIFGLPPRYGESALQNLMTLPSLPDVEFVVACPFARGNMGYQGPAEQDVYDVLADVKRRYSIDEDRVYVTGSSMGGGAALWLALTRPDVWAAAAPVCAAPMPGSEELAGNALNVPVRLFHGEQDPLTPPAISRQWQKRFLDAGVPVDYVEFPGVRHNAWDFAYRGRTLFEWFANQKRNRAPDHIRFSTRAYLYQQAYWLRIDGLTPGTLASVDAVRNDAGVKVVTQNVEAFTLTAPAKSVSVDGTAVRLRAGAPLTFVKGGGKWSQGAYTPSGKRPGSEGPIVDAFRTRHIWVYGTAGNFGGEEMDHRRAVAEAGAAAWSSARGRVNPGAVVIKADRDVTPEELAGANLILFGTKETNTLIARMAARLPMELNSGAADYGMVMILPSGSRYVVVSSGLPWWTGAEETDRTGYRFGPRAYGLLSTFGDFLVFRGGLGRVVAEGRFDRDWKMPADAAGTLRASGVVEVR